MAIVLDAKLFPSLRGSASAIQARTVNQSPTPVVVLTVPVANASPIAVSAGRALRVRTTMQAVLNDGSNGVAFSQEVIAIVSAGTPTGALASSAHNSQGLLTTNNSVGLPDLTVTINSSTHDLDVSVSNYDTSYTLDVIIDCELSMFGTA